MLNPARSRLRQAASQFTSKYLIERESQYLWVFLIEAQGRCVLNLAYSVGNEGPFSGTR